MSDQQELGLRWVHDLAIDDRSSRDVLLHGWGIRVANIQWDNAIVRRALHNNDRQDGRLEVGVLLANVVEGFLEEALFFGHDLNDCRGLFD